MKKQNFRLVIISLVILLKICHGGTRNGPKNNKCIAATHIRVIPLIASYKAMTYEADETVTYDTLKRECQQLPYAEPGNPKCGAGIYFYSEDGDCGGVYYRQSNSVENSVGNPVGNSVGNYVENSVGNSVGNPVGNSAGVSVSLESFTDIQQEGRIVACYLNTFNMKTYICASDNDPPSAAANRVVLRDNEITVSFDGHYYTFERIIGHSDAMSMWSACRHLHPFCPIMTINGGRISSYFRMIEEVSVPTDTGNVMAIKDVRFFGSGQNNLRPALFVAGSGSLSCGYRANKPNLLKCE